MADFAERVIKLHPSQMPLFYRTMEWTDNAVLSDHYQLSRAKAEKAKEDAANKPRRSRRKG